MKFMQWKNLRIDPTQPETTIQEKLVAFVFLGVPALVALLISISLGSENEMYWALAALGLGFMLALRMMHPGAATANWKKLFWVNGLPMLVVPILLEFGMVFWSFGAAAALHFAVKFYYKQTKNEVQS